MRWRRIVLCAVIVLAVLGGAAWYWQSHLIGQAARWYLAWVASGEEARGDLSRRRDAVGRTHRMLLLAPPADQRVPELFDLITAVSSRVATGEIDLAWAAYVYTSYERDLALERPSGVPRRSMGEVEDAVQEYVTFYSLQKRPDVAGFRLRDLMGSEPGQSYTVEEIEKAAREGRKLPDE
jgi:hypothetical protein